MVNQRAQVRPTFSGLREVVNDVMARNALLEERRYGTVANNGKCGVVANMTRAPRGLPRHLWGYRSKLHYYFYIRAILRGGGVRVQILVRCTERLDKKTKDLLLLERSFSIVQSERDDLNKKCNQLKHERDKLSANLRDLELEHEKLLKLLEEKTNRLNEETILRVELENTVTTLKEDLEFKRNMYEQTLKESTTRRLIEISEVDAGVADYEARLKIDLQETRQLYEQQMEENRKEMEELFRQQLKDMNLDSIRDADVANIRLEELHQMRTRMESANKIIADLEAQNASLSARMRDLEQTLEMERIAHAEDKTVLIREIDSLRSKLAENMREFQELLNVKVSLDAEISTYRSLLKNEEHRLNISPGGSSSGSAIRSSQFQQQTPIRRGTPQRGAKRKRTTLEESASLSESNYRVSSKATGDIEIIEVCSEGKFVKLHNKGNKEIVLSGWQIHRVAGEEETIFKFHRSVKMEPDVTITVWSSDAGQTHEPPTNIVMKSQRWFVADNMTTTLINSSAEEVARSERERQQLSSMSSHLRETSGGFASTSRFEGEDIFHQKGDPPAGKDETCRLMTLKTSLCVKVEDNIAVL
uniref:Lamin n=1 Tax=Timema tahoe TaxID=61484 RepID=A0A7R9FIG2_9NEOP|nr:unnamed protein product [Timema tahoe]